MKKTWCFLKLLFNRFFDDQCPTQAASLAYTTLLSIVPLIIFIFYLLSFFPGLQNAGKEIERFILNNFIASSANIIADQLQNFVMHMALLSWMNICALAFISLLLIFNMVVAVNSIWHVKMKGYFAWSFVLYLLVLLIAPIGFAILLLFSSYLTSLPLISHVVNVTVFKKTVLYGFPFVIEWIVFSQFHWLIPSCRVYFRYAAIAGLVTTCLFEAAKWGFVQYLHYFPTYQLVYGALSTIPIFFVWVYVCWLVILLGAEICHLLQTRGI